MAARARVGRVYWSEPETAFLVGLASAGLGLREIGRHMVEAGWPNRGRLRWWYKLREQVQGVRHVIDEGEPLHSDDRAKLLEFYQSNHTDEQTASALARSTREIRELVAAEGLPPMRTSAQRVARGRPKVDDIVCASEAEAGDLALASLRSRMSNWRRDPAAAERRRVNAERVRQAQAVRASRSRPYRPQVSEQDVQAVIYGAARA